METENSVTNKQKSSAQEVLISKLLKAKVLTDKEYHKLKRVYKNQVLTTSDASIFIDHLLCLIKFRRTFLSKKHKAHKQCVFCETREDVSRYLDLSSGKREWVCETCAVNLDTSKVIPVKIQESNEVKADLHKVHAYPAEIEAQDEDSIHLKE